MKKNFFKGMAVFAMMVMTALTVASCGDDNDNVTPTPQPKDPELTGIEYKLKFTVDQVTPADLMPVKLAYYDASGQLQVKDVTTQEDNLSVVYKSNSVQQGFAIVRMLKNDSTAYTQESYNVNVYAEGTKAFVYDDGTRKENKMIPNSGIATVISGGSIADFAVSMPITIGGSMLKDIKKDGIINNYLNVNRNYLNYLAYFANDKGSSTSIPTEVKQKLGLQDRVRE